MDIAQYIRGKLGKSPNEAGEIHTFCPFHEDKHASFSINVEKGVFLCRSTHCGIRGNFFLFYKLMEGITSWKEVYKALRSPTMALDLDALLGIKDEKIIRYKVNEWPSEFFVEFAKPSVSYFLERQLNEEIINTFCVHKGLGGEVEGVDLSRSLVLPIYDVDGEYRTFQVRYLYKGAKPRWKNPSKSAIQTLLYGGWLVNDRTENLWIVEGASDAWKLFQFGEQAVALFTKEASSSQLNRLYSLCRNWNLTPIICLDGDASAWEIHSKDYPKKLYDELFAMGLYPKEARLAYDEDPGGLTEERFLEVKDAIQ